MKYSSNLKKIIKESQRLSGGDISPNHLLLGIVNITDSTANKVLSKIIDVDEAHKRFSAILGGKVLEVDEDIQSKLTPEAENIVMQSQLEAKKFGSDEVKSEHLVLALARARIIDSVTYKDIEKIVKNMNNINDELTNDTPISKNKKKSILDDYCVDLTNKASENKLDPVVGRKKELKRIAQVLSRRKKNNPVLIGDPGVGKTAIVEGLAQMIINKQTPDILYNKRVLSLDMSSIVAGTKFRGDFEDRMKKILDELKETDDIILFIDEIHTIVGAGGASGALDAANILKPALSRGEISCIGSTTNEEYKKIEKDGALDRRFQKIRIYEPTYKETNEILNQLKERYELHHLVEYTPESIEACLKLSDRYISDRKFPDKAIDVMDEAGAAVRVNQSVPQEIIDKEKEIDEINKRKLKKVHDQDFEGASVDKKITDKLKEELLEIKKEIQEKNNKNRTKVSADDIADVVSIMTGIPAKNVTDDDSTKLIEIEKNLKSWVIGQDEAISNITKSILRNKTGLGDTNKPIGTFLFLGPTGVGKTFIAKKLAEQLFTSEKDMIRVDMSEYMEKHSVSKLIGAPPGYVGHDDGGQLTDLVRRKPYSVILLDEIEKAHSDVTNVLLQMFDDGILTDSHGRTVDFKNTVIIMTSNIGSREAKLRGNGIGFNSGADNNMGKSIVEKELKNKFAPEFLNRLDNIVSFNSLSKDNIKSIIDIELKKFIIKVDEIGITIEIDDTAKDFLFEKGWDSEMGARPLKRALQKYIEDEISIKLITKEIKKGDKIRVIKSLSDDSLEFLTVTNLLSEESIDSDISETK